MEEQPILLNEKDEYEKVSVNIKVLNVLDPITVPTAKKYIYIIGDSSTTSKCTLWEDDIGSLEVGSYLLKKFHVHDYRSKKFISKAREDSEILAIYDIGVTASNKEHPQPAEIHKIGFVPSY